MSTSNAIPMRGSMRGFIAGRMRPHFVRSVETLKTMLGDELGEYCATREDQGCRTISKRQCAILIWDQPSKGGVLAFVMLGVAQRDSSYLPPPAICATPRLSVGLKLLF